jgi:hypothetical protein
MSPGSTAILEPADDQDILDDDALYRRLSHSGADMILVDQVTGERRPASGAFKPDDDGISVYRRALLQKHGLAAIDVTRAPSNVVVSVGVEDVRSLQLGVVNNAWPPDVDDPSHLRNAAHALIKGLELLGTKERKRRQRALAQLPSIAFVYP